MQELLLLLLQLLLAVAVNGIVIVICISYNGKQKIVSWTFQEQLVVLTSNVPVRMAAWPRRRSGSSLSDDVCCRAIEALVVVLC